MVSVELDNSKSHSKLKPSSDTPTHLELYKAYDQINDSPPIQFMRQAGRNRTNRFLVLAPLMLIIG